MAVGDKPRHNRYDSYNHISCTVGYHTQSRAQLTSRRERGLRYSERSRRPAFSRKSSFQDGVKASSARMRSSCCGVSSLAFDN